MIKRLVWIIILAAILVYSIPKMLEQFSLLIDRLNSNDAVEEEISQDLLFPPILDTLPEATNSAEITIKGFAQNADHVEVYINDIKKETVTIGTKDGSFIVSDIRLYEGNNAVAAIAYGSRGEKSNLSEPLTVFYKHGIPKLIVESPDDGAVITGSSNLELRGITDPENTLTVNGRWTRVLTDGTFKSSMTLNEGENRLEIKTRDRAGNETTITRTLTYTK